MPKTNTHHTSIWSVFLIFFRLGLTSFGGPVAHLSYFHNAFVRHRQWISDKRYADLVALCQFLPGPASSQVGFAIGISRAGYWGGFAAWLGFTIPSAVVLILFALGLSSIDNSLISGAIKGLKIVAVAVVAQAVWGMARMFCTNIPKITLMGLATCIVLIVSSAWSQIGVILIAGTVGLWLFSAPQQTHEDLVSVKISKSIGWVCLSLFFLLLFGLPVLNQMLAHPTLTMVDVFYRTGSLVFGGGHVVLPLLQAEITPLGWVNNETFMAGYGAAQAVPGPLFTFSAFLGASSIESPNGWLGGMISLVSIFIPSLLLMIGALPFWEQLRKNQSMQKALIGINASVVGILLAAFYDPVFTSAIQHPIDFAFALLAFIALMFWKLPPWLVVLASAGIGWLLQTL
ncbi:chromate efflux transporter [Marinicella sp. W31]|uniref:chromate efflux transporter n=1 Tax=Marinicella sp. W31 TaxID=3023713 RepID=UPI003756BF88